MLAIPLEVAVKFPVEVYVNAAVVEPRFPDALTVKLPVPRVTPVPVKFPLLAVKVAS